LNDIEEGYSNVQDFLNSDDFDSALTEADSQIQDGYEVAKQINSDYNSFYDRYEDLSDDYEDWFDSVGEYTEGLLDEYGLSDEINDFLNPYEHIDGRFNYEFSYLNYTSGNY